MKCSIVIWRNNYGIRRKISSQYLLWVDSEFCVFSLIQINIDDDWEITKLWVDPQYVLWIYFFFFYSTTNKYIHFSVYINFNVWIVLHLQIYKTEIFVSTKYNIFYSLNLESNLNLWEKSTKNKQFICFISPIQKITK